MAKTIEECLYRAGWIAAEAIDTGRMTRAVDFNRVLELSARYPSYKAGYLEFQFPARLYPEE